tara:strand:+ start:2081 stop:3070 length:990 start_codon:yes stop_codon:yes gene_type:complete
MSTFEQVYCNTTTDLLFIEPYLAQYDGKRVLPSNFVASGVSHLFYLYNSGDVSGQLYLDGQEMTSTTSQPSSNNEYRYTAASDLLELYQSGGSASTLNSSLVESSSDWATLKTDAVKRASDFIRGYLPFPIYPNKGVGTQDSTERNYPEIIVRSCAIMAVESLVRPYDSEKADLIRNQAINEQGTGFLDMLRTGQVHLYSSESEYKKRGILRIVSQNANSTGGIVDVKGTPSYSWDVIKIIITAGGTISEGVANETVKFSSFIGNENGLKLQAMAIDEIIDCYWQLVGHSMYCRFSPGLYTLNDEFELEVSGVTDQMFTPIKRVQMTRK